MWVSYGVQGDLSLMQAYSMHPKGWIYDDSRVYRLDACSNGFYGLWSNGSILWAAGVSGRGVQPVFAFDWANRPAKGPSTTTTRLRWWLAFTAGGAASLVGAARPLVA